MQSNFYIKKINNYCAGGSGEEFILGSLHSTQGQPPEKRITKALEASCYFDNYSEPPLNIVYQAKTEEINNDT